MAHSGTAHRLEHRARRVVAAIGLAIATAIAFAGASPARSNAAVVDTLVVKYREDVLPPSVDALPPETMHSLAQALQSGFARIDRTRDGAYRFALNPPLPIDEARAAMNKVRMDRTVLYVNIVERDPAPRRIAQPKAGIVSEPPVRALMIKYKDPRLVAAAASDTPMPQTQLDRIAAYAGTPVAHQRIMSGGEYVVRFFQPMSTDAASAVARRLEQDSDVAYADPDLWKTINLVPNDPLYASSQWHYMPTVSEIGGANLPAAWDITTGASNVVVSVIDTGSLPNHPDLSGRYVGGYDMIYDYLVANDGSPAQPAGCTANGVFGDPLSAPCISSRDSDAADPGDWIADATDQWSNFSSWFSGCGPDRNSSWHGTHVAGTIGALSNNAAGIAGINWTSKILPVRALGKCGGYTSDIVDGMTWASGGAVSGVPANPNVARVLNLSLGGFGPCAASEQTAINNALSRGAVVVIAAGNEADDAINHSPGNCNGVITVAATERQGRRAFYSNFGSMVEIAAPGGDAGANPVFSTLNSGTTVPSTYIYAGYSGTSMATPHVAGIASLMLSASSMLTPGQILAIIQTTARTFPAPGPACTNPPTFVACNCTTALCGAGIIDAGAAVAAAVTASGNNVRDLDYDGFSDFFWRHQPSGAVWGWLMSNSTVLAQAKLGGDGADANWQPVGSGRFNTDSKADLVWRNSVTGAAQVRLMNGLSQTGSANVGGGLDWKVIYVADFNGDGKSDLLWQSAATGNVYMWLMNGTGILTNGVGFMGGDANWEVVGTPDLNGDGKADLLWRNKIDGKTVAWFMNGLSHASEAFVGGDTSWKIAATGDLNGDGKTDLLWVNSETGNVVVWLMNGATSIAQGFLGGDANYKILGTGDYSDDGRSDVVWLHSPTGLTFVWFMNGLVKTSSFTIGGDASWKALLP